MKLGLKVGLGTDVAGGISPSMLTAIRMAVVNRSVAVRLQYGHSSADVELL